MKTSVANRLSIVTFVTAIVTMILLLTICGACTEKINTVNGNTCYMACHYTVRCGVVLSVLGMIFSLESIARHQNMPFLLITFGIFFFFLPSITGICMKAGMECHNALALLRITGVVFGLIGLIQLMAKGKYDL